MEKSNALTKKALIALALISAAPSMAQGASLNHAGEICCPLSAQFDYGQAHCSGATQPVSCSASTQPFFCGASTQPVDGGQYEDKSYRNSAEQNYISDNSDRDDEYQRLLRKNNAAKNSGSNGSKNFVSSADNQNTYKASKQWASPVGTAAGTAPGNISDNYGTQPGYRINDAQAGYNRVDSQNQWNNGNNQNRNYDNQGSFRRQNRENVNTVSEGQNSSYQGTTTGPGPDGAYPGTPRGVYPAQPGR